VLIRHLILESRDPAAQAAFWADLGVPTTRQPDGTTTVALARTTIAFAPADPPPEPGYHFAINVPAGRVADARTWIEPRVPLLPFGDGEVQIRFEAIAADAIYFLDPDGNDVELIARDAVAADASAPFGPQHLLEVSEIGLATADVPATREAICQTLQAPVFWGNRHGHGLCAVGDDVGAILVSPIGRGWIPIDLPARPLPTTVVADAPAAGAVTLAEGPYRIEGAPAA
jgi:catechol 2,3-dioxygenase-like lactoylglutathione lyase family enzyme